ncbi:MAG: hypothetical protein VX278_02835 [Myxococcota bacterium]|nr:hypothetical protein [Myxococcota bacterium]
MILFLSSLLRAYPAWLENPYHEINTEETLICTLAQQNLSDPAGIVYDDDAPRISAIVAEAQSVRLSLEYIHGQMDLHSDANRFLSYLGQNLGYMQRDFWLYEGKNAKSFIRACFHKDSPLAKPPTQSVNATLKEGVPPKTTTCSVVRYNFYSDLRNDLKDYPPAYLTPLLRGIESRALQDSMVYAYIQNMQKSPPSLYTLRDLSNHIRDLHSKSSVAFYYRFQRKDEIPVVLSVSLCLP